MLVIQDIEQFKDFEVFMQDPNVKVLSKDETDTQIIYKFNTNETIAIPKSIIENDKKELDDLIFGKDKTKNIINVSISDSYAELHFNDGTTKFVDYKPWMLSNYPNGMNSKRLKGNQYYKYINKFDYEEYLEEEKLFNRAIWKPRKIEEGYLLTSGTTYFKDMKLEDLSVLSFDIETSGLAHDKTSKVYIISNTFRNNNGKIQRRLFSVDEYISDTEMIHKWAEWVRNINPNVMLGHNIFGFDLPYLNYCSGNLLQLGKDGSPIKFDEKVSKFRKDGSQQYEYYNARINGREIIDTFFLSIKYDIGREFPSYGLKPIIKHLGLEKKDRQFYDAIKIKDNWNNLKERKKIKQYAEEDSDDALKLFDLMVPSFFYLTQSIPKTFQQIINEATGSQLDAFMIRAYLQNGYSQPKTSTTAEFQGAISFGIPGFYKNVFSVDFASLYPSIIREYKLFDKVKDPKGYLLMATNYFTEMRLKNKQLTKETKEKYYDDLQSSQKILINSIYGFYGANYLLYNSPIIASTITKIGRDLLNQICEVSTGKNIDYWKEKVNV